MTTKSGSGSGDLRFTLLWILICSFWFCATILFDKTYDPAAILDMALVSLIFIPGFSLFLIFAWAVAANHPEFGSTLQGKWTRYFFGSAYRGWTTQICTVFLILMMYALEYRQFGLKATTGGTEDPSSGLICLYFSVVTWTTVGYGDFVPIGFSRVLASFEALTGYVVMAMLIAALLAIFRPRK